MRRDVADPGKPLDEAALQRALAGALPGAKAKLLGETKGQGHAPLQAVLGVAVDAETMDLSDKAHSIRRSEREEALVGGAFRQ